MTRIIALLLTATTLAFCQQSTPYLQHRRVDRPPYTPPSLLLKEPPPLHPVDPLVVLHGQRDKKVVALTFDACSTRKPSQYDERITKILVETKTAATLFLGGKWMEDDTEQTKYLSSIPYFELGNHTFLHPHLLKMSDDRIRQELAWTQQLLFSLTGKQTTLFRPPYGEEDGRVVRIAASMGLTTIQFDLASGDPDSSISKERLIEHVSSMAKSGSIIVMHINRRGWHTAEALPEIISRLRKRGFTFVTVGELLSGLKPSRTTKQKARE
ncbi:MAG: polysaccharide deacetylase family protein [Ignavibacteriales bacterium]|nr:polysaccharide deacetylase family protein [Ignavibacteriales bacterium]